MITAVLLGLLVGLVIGTLGGGGGVLAVPVLVYLLGQSAQDATAGSVVIVGAVAVVGTLMRARGQVDWRTGLTLGAVGIPAAYLGTLANRGAPEPLLLLSFAALTLLAAGAMLAGTGRSEPDPAPSPAGSTRVATRPARARASTAALVGGCGLAVGFLTGFLGVGGGFLVVPVLVLVLGMSIRLAAGTSLLVIALNAVAAVVSRGPSVADLDWVVLAPFAVAAIAASLAGKRVADRLSGTTLTRAFAVLLILVGGFVAAQAAGSI